MEKRRQIAIVAGTLSLAALAMIDPPSADIRILTHERADTSPARFQAGIDLGLASASILVTWTTHQLTR